MLALLLAPAARADEQQSHTQTALGPRGVFYRPKNADHGAWSPGGQLNVHAGGPYVIQGSADVAHYTAAGASWRSVPLQVTLIDYLTPEDPASFYVLAGYGWYFNRVDGPGAHSETLAHPHAGAGVELLSGVNWSFDADYRFIWSATYKPWTSDHPFGSNYQKRGSMITLALTRRF